FGIASCYNNIGNAYDVLTNYEESLKYYLLALNIQKEIGDQEGIATSLANIGAINIKLFRKDPKSSERLNNTRKYLNSALQISKEIGSKECLQETYSSLSSLDSIKGNYKDALENYKLFIACRDSMLNEENTKKTVQTQMQYDFDKKESETKAEQDKKDI